MSLTKQDLAAQVAQTAALPKMVATQAVEAALEMIKSSLTNGDDVLVSGFGTFVANRKAARLGRNPQTGDALMLKARTVVTFKSSRGLRGRVSEGGNGEVTGP
jgi:integration host factor subunit alpha